MRVRVYLDVSARLSIPLGAHKSRRRLAAWLSRPLYSLLTYLRAA